MFHRDRSRTGKEVLCMSHERVAQALLDRLAPEGGGAVGERIWRFSQRMGAAYLQQMETFNQDKEARQWQRLYSADNMPPPDDTRNMAEVAAQMAFYFPTHFFKVQKAAAQQLLEWHSRQAQLNPYPFGTTAVTLIDVGAGLVSTATPPAKEPGVELIGWSSPFRCSCRGNQGLAQQCYRSGKTLLIRCSQAH